MPTIERGNFDNPTKSAYNFEVFDSGLERKMMERLESDHTVRKWTKKHGIVIPWIDPKGKRHNYRPDFLVEYTDGDIALIEVKGANQVDSETVQRKAEAAKRWCKRREMSYSIATIQ
ncbi:MAG: TnsA endonuclease N-terminal domain-containing protein [Chloroflexi bacterium]|nr:TnsA endonuclease N-terminal domain-containing protein [Chloroflexota bacterium]MCY3696585.1 TnsA endonuclease N-terminal domain-containing protein [Chloroflexota bacterium]